MNDHEPPTMLQLPNLSEANVLSYEMQIMAAARDFVEWPGHAVAARGGRRYVCPVPVADVVQMVQQLMTLVYAQQKVVIDAEHALQPTAEKLGVIEKAIATANARIIAVEKERDEAEQKYQDLCTHLADVEQGHLGEMQELYNSMQE